MKSYTDVNGSEIEVKISKGSRWDSGPKLLLKLEPGEGVTQPVFEMEADDARSMARVLTALADALEA